METIELNINIDEYIYIICLLYNNIGMYRIWPTFVLITIYENKLKILVLIFDTIVTIVYMIHLYRKLTCSIYYISLMIRYTLFVINFKVYTYTCKIL